MWRGTMRGLLELLLSLSMNRSFPDTGTNWVSWLRTQAAEAYAWDDRAQYWRVRQELPYKVHPRLKDAWHALPGLLADFPQLNGNLFARCLQDMDSDTKDRIEDFFMAQGYADFQFLGHGGRALAFRARHIPSGQIHVARMEAPHSARSVRPVHPVVLQALASNEDDMQMHGDMKLEVLPEIVPLTKLHSPVAHTDNTFLHQIYNRAVYDLALGTNLFYPTTMFDHDCEPQNIGIRPDGRIVSFDPAFLLGRKGERRQIRFRTPSLLQDASTQQLALVYPTI